MRSNFEYLRPESVADAIIMKEAHGDGAVYWAGGTDLVLQWKSGKVSPSWCVDLSALQNLSYIKDEPDKVRIGAMTSLADLERAERNNMYLNTIADVAVMMCTVQSRTLATVAGNLCNASPAGDLIPTFFAMGAIIKVCGPDGEREFPIEDMMVSPGKTSLWKSELVIEIIIPKTNQPHASSYRRIDRTVVDIALVSAATSLGLDAQGKIATARVALGAVAPRVIFSPKAEGLLLGRGLSDLNDEFMKKVGLAASSDAMPISDIRASAEYRSAMIKVLVARTLNDNLLALEGQSS
jgi:CO/xanthine dehydrogenase FAD-binding subunit